MIRDSQSSDGMKAQTKSFLAFLTLLTAIYGFWLMVFWPGVLGQDSIAILLEVNDPINQASGKPAFWYFFVKLFYSGHEHVEAPIGVIMLLSAIIQTRILSWTWSRGLKKTAIFLFVFICTAPQAIFFIGTLYPDGVYSIAIAGLLFELWIISESKKISKTSLLLILVIPFAAFSRPNGIIFLVPVAVLALWLWKQNRRASVFLTTLLALNCLLIGLINSAHPNRSHGSLYPLVIYETVNFLQPRPMNLWVASPRVSQKTVDAMEKHKPLQVYLENYDRDYWDPLVFKSDGPQVLNIPRSERKIIIREFFRYNLWRNIPAFLSSRVNIFLTSAFAQGGLPSHTYAEQVIKIIKSRSEYRIFKLTDAEKLLFNEFEVSYNIRWLLWTPFLGLALLFIAMRDGITKCNKSLLLISIPMIVQLGGIFLFSIAGEYRYILPFFTITLVFLPILQMKNHGINTQK